MIATPRTDRAILRYETDGSDKAWPDLEATMRTLERELVEATRSISEGNRSHNEAIIAAGQYSTAAGHLQAHADDLARRLRYARGLSGEAYSYLDADMNMKALKLLAAMAGRSTGYRADVDATWDLQLPNPNPAPSTPIPPALSGGGVGKTESGDRVGAIIDEPGLDAMIERVTKRESEIGIACTCEPMGPRDCACPQHGYDAMPKAENAIGHGETDQEQPTDWVLPAKYINDLQQATLGKTVSAGKAGHLIDVHVRIGGQWKVFEGDWIKHLEPRRILSQGTSQP